MMSEKEKTVAEQLHESYIVQSKVEDIIMEAFEKYEPETYKNAFDFHISSDWYDNSIEIFLDGQFPYPYEPCDEIRKMIYDLGFGIVYWNFLNETTQLYDEEIRGYKPRHYKNGVGKPCKFGYVDDRFIADDWCKKYNFKNIK